VPGTVEEGQIVHGHDAATVVKDDLVGAVMAFPARSVACTEAVYVARGARAADGEKVAVLVCES
jgi:hypothetical protein